MVKQKLVVATVSGSNEGHSQCRAASVSPVNNDLGVSLRKLRRRELRGLLDLLRQ